MIKSHFDNPSNIIQPANPAGTANKAMIEKKFSKERNIMLTQNQIKIIRKAKNMKPTTIVQNVLDHCFLSILFHEKINKQKESEDWFFEFEESRIDIGTLKKIVARYQKLFPEFYLCTDDSNLIVFIKRKMKAEIPNGNLTSGEIIKLRNTIIDVKNQIMIRHQHNPATEQNMALYSLQDLLGNVSVNADGNDLEGLPCVF